MNARRLSLTLLIVSMFALAHLGFSQSPSATTGPDGSQRHDPAPPKNKRTRPSRGEADMWQIPTRDLPERGRIGSFNSFIVDKPVSYIVFLPIGYDYNPTYRYPVIYLLPGFGGDCREGGPMLEMFDKATKVKVCPPVIVVSVQGILGSFYTDARDHGRPIESVIIKELIPRIDATYRTVNHREFRGIEGFSMGGFGAAHLAFKYPETFGVVSMFAPIIQTLKAFQEESPDVATDVWNNDQKYFDENDPYLLLEKNADKIRSMKIRLFVGADDRYRVCAEDLHERMNALKIDHDFKIIPGVKHNQGALLSPIASEVFPFWRDAFGKEIPPWARETTQPEHIGK